MKHKQLKGFLALLVIVLTGAVACSGASAAQFLSEQEVTTISNNSSGSQYLSVGGYTFHCTGPAFSNTEVGNRTEEGGGGYGTSGYNTGTLTDPSCYAATVKWNGCELELNASEKGANENGTVDIGPPGCGPIKVNYGYSCEWTIPSQTGLGAGFSSSGEGTGRQIGASIGTWFKYNNITGPGCGGAAGEKTDGRWTAQFGIEGSDGKGNPVGIQRAGIAYSEGLYIGKNPATSEYQFQTSSYPTKLGGTVSKTHRFEVGANGFSIECQVGTLSGATERPNFVLTLTPTYTGCANKLGQTVTVSMNSCQYVFAPLSTTSGGAGITCSHSGDVIEFHVGNICTYTLEARELGSSSYSAVGTGLPEVQAEVEGSGIKYTRTLNLLFCPKAAEAGTFAGGFKLGVQ